RLSLAEFNKLQSAKYNETTGTVTLSFVDDVTSFSAALELQPTLYEDYDVDHDNADPFNETGMFFGDDLRISLEVSDTNTITDDTFSGAVSFDVDVDPVNNSAVIVVAPRGNEGVIDAAGGVWDFSFTPIIADTDGSETITGVLLGDVPSGVVPYVEDLNNPTGPKIPALLASADTPAGFNVWALDQNQWNTVELRGIPKHYAGPFPVTLTIITTEADGGGTGTTSISNAVYIDPVIDGGNPGGSAITDEDTKVFLPLDGNIIDNTKNSPESPEEVFGNVVIDNVSSDSKLRIPRFFLGEADGSGGPFTELFLTGGSLTLTTNQALRLYVQQGRDSNENPTFDVTMSYRETLDNSQQTTVTQTISVNVTGVADRPTIDGQDPDPSNAPNGIADSNVNATFRPTQTTGGLDNVDLVYGYAGKSGTPFELDQRLSNAALQFGFTSGAPETLTAAKSLSAEMQEITFSGPDDFDGSETLYYLITGVDPNVVFLNAQPTTPTADTYLVTNMQLANLQVDVQSTSQVEYYPMKLHAIVVEDDAAPISLTGLTSQMNQILAGIVNVNAANAIPLNGSIEDKLALLDATKGYAVESLDFAVVALPDTGGGGGGTPEQKLPLPDLYTTGTALEDSPDGVKLTLHLTPSGPYQDLEDLLSLPGISGSFGFGIEIPPGSSISSEPPGAVLFDVVNGVYVVDLNALGIDPNDKTQTIGKLVFFPPEHESSPVNPFLDGQTLGPDDPYDGLNSLEAKLILENASCGTVTSGTEKFEFEIIPVADGPAITIGATSFDEDTLGDLGLTVEGIDGGERLVGNVTIEVDNTNGGTLFDANGNPLSGSSAGGVTTYTVAAGDIAGLQLGAGTHFSGDISVTVTATTEDINGDTASNSVSADIYVIPVADVPQFDFDTSVIDPETGQPYVSLTPRPTITAIEDQAFNLSTVLEADSPDQDGSEARTIILSNVPDYLLVDGPAGSGFVNNGDGSYTIAISAWPQVSVRLKNEHERTPDALNPTIPDKIPLTISVTTLELANSDQAANSTVFDLQIRPDADVPVLTADVTPDQGVEDDGQVYTLQLEASTPDPHETLAFRIAQTTGLEILVDGVVQSPVGGFVTVPGVASGSGFVPAGTIALRPLQDFSGTVNVPVTAITTDSGVLFTDTETAAAQVTVTIDPSGDIDLTVTPIMDMETDAVVTISPSADWQFTITDSDGNAPVEIVDTVTLSLSNMPAGVIIAGAPAGTVTYDPVTGGDFTFTGSEADYAALTLGFPADFNTDIRYDGAPDGPITGTILVTSTEDATGASAPVSIDISADVDLTIATVDPQPNPATQTTTPLTIALGIDAVIDTTIGESLDEVRVIFDQLPAGTTASAGTVSGNALTVTRGAMSPADFLLLVAALTITLPASFGDDLIGEVQASSSEGNATSVAFTIDINATPEISGPVSINSDSRIVE
ncbi:MAG: hypothetical protein HRU31_17710, partial [Rhodobacteraceae bacterium]|nr:hypothetical protein [Paracoccaceae bacterium]